MGLFSTFKQTMDLDLREISRRFNFFIDICFNGKARELSRASGINESTISRIRSGSETTISTLLNFRKIGLNPAWLLSDVDHIVSMYANNQSGKSLRKAHGDIPIPNDYKTMKKGELYILRANEWLTKNYKSIDIFVNKYGINFGYSVKDIEDILIFKYPPAYDFYEMLASAGCTREYLEHANTRDEKQVDSTKVESIVYDSVQKALKDYFKK
jgi:hypothetical protein